MSHEAETRTIAMAPGSSLRKAAILITAIDARSADRLLEQMSEAQAARVRQAVFELDEVDPREQQQIVAEFLRSTGRGPESASVAEDSPTVAPPQAAPRSESPDVELVLTREAEAAPEPAQPLREEAEKVLAYESYAAAYPPPGSVRPTRRRPFEFLSESRGLPLAKLLGREHPQTIAVVMAHLPSRQAAELLAELSSDLQAEVLQRVADYAEADPEAIHAIEQELWQWLDAPGQPQEAKQGGISTVSSILTAAGEARGELLHNLRQHDRQLSQRLGYLDETTVASSTADSGQWAFDPAEEFAGGSSARDLQSEIQQHRRLAHSARQMSESAVPDQPSRPPAEANRQRQPRLQWTFDDLAQLSDTDLARVLKHAESELTLVALAGAETAFVSRLVDQLPPALARQFSRQVEAIGPLSLRDIEAAQNNMAEIAALLAEQGFIAQRANRRFAVAA